MRLSLVSQLLLVFISVLALTRAQTTSATTTSASTLADPCYSYTVLNDSRRATNNRFSSQPLCDTEVNWSGWYRLFIQDQSAQMPDTCVDKRSCGTYVPLWLDGGHPTVEDGVVTRAVCGHWSNNCCWFRSNSIKVKACPGNYYVYEFVSPIGCTLAYCAEVRNITTNNATVTPNTDNVIGLQVKLSSFLDLTQSGNIEIVLQQIKQVLVNTGLPSNIELELRKVQKIKP